jgi:hypothetical protein
MKKFSIIGQDIHILIKIKPKEDWSNHPWRFASDQKDMYWVPVPNELRDQQSNHPVCRSCKRDHLRSLQNKDY